MPVFIPMPPVLVNSNFEQISLMESDVNGILERFWRHADFQGAEARAYGNSYDERSMGNYR